MKGNSPTKPSGIPWLGDIPTDWEVKRLKYVAKLRSGEAITIDAIEAEGAYPVFGGNGLRGYTERYTNEGTYVLIGRQGALCGNVNYAHGKFWASEHAVVCHPVAETEPIWLGELLRSMDLGQYSQSAAQPGLAVERIESLLIPVPPLPTQRAIAAFLVERTARIDGLVARKQRLVQLLKEKRQALITRAVTRGLDAKVKLKESGVPWLGMVPEHWGVKKLKHLIGPMEQGWSPQCDNYPAEEGEWGVLKAGCVNGTSLNELENKRLPVNEEPILELEIKPGDILMSRANTTELLGSCGYVEKVRPRLILCDKLYRFHAILGVSDGRYLVHFLRSRAGRSYMEQNTSGASDSMQNIGQDIVRNIDTPFPPITEQRTIVAHIERETTHLDTLITNVEVAVLRLQEYRTALISAAVTGKVGV